MTDFKLMKQIIGLLGLKPKQADENCQYIGLYYEGVMIANTDVLFDYGEGILFMSIGNSKFKEGAATVSITSIDDGNWIGYANTPVHIENLAVNFIHRFRNKLPDEATLNDFLSKYGIYGGQF